MRRIAITLTCLAALACGGCKTLEVKSVTVNFSLNLPVNLPGAATVPGGAAKP